MGLASNELELSVRFRVVKLELLVVVVDTLGPTENGLFSTEGYSRLLVVAEARARDH